MLVSARVTPFTASRAASMANSRSRLFSMGMLNGSILQGEAQSALAGGSGTRYNSCDFTLDDALAISTALAAQPSTPSRDRSSVAAKPNPPLAMTRMPTPSDLRVGGAGDSAVLGSEAHGCVRPRCGPPACEAPRSLAVSSAHEAISFIYDHRIKDDIVFFRNVAPSKIIYHGDTERTEFLVSMKVSPWLLG